MTRLSSDSESTTTEHDLVTNGNILSDTNTQEELERLLRQLRQGIQISAIETESEDQYTTSTEPPQPASINLNEDNDPEEVEFEFIPLQEAIIQEAQEHRHQVLGNYNHYIEYQSSNEDEEESSSYNGQETSPRPFEGAVYEFGLTSARRVTAHSVLHGEDYDLRPKFAILKHKTEHLTGINQDARRPTPERAYPKTPEWFFNIPDTRTPFTNFESKLSDDVE